MASEEDAIELTQIDNCTSCCCNKAKELAVLRGTIERQQKLIELLEKELESLPEYIIRYQAEHRKLQEILAKQSEQLTVLQGKLDAKMDFPRKTGSKYIVYDV